MGQCLISDDSMYRCHFCHCEGLMHRHHIFGGANRKWSEKYGLYVHLCPRHHNMSNEGIHFNKDMMDAYHELGQRAFETHYMAMHDCGVDAARIEFRRIFGRNYLD